MSLPGAEFPRVLRRVWRVTDPSTRRERRSNALDRPTVQQLLRTHRGDYWVCSETGQFESDGPSVQVGELTQLYDEWWKDHLALGPPSERDNEKRRRFIADLEAYRKTGRLLEVGSGRGKILKAAVNAGWKAEGNELSPVAARAAVELSGARVWPGPVGDLRLEPGAYDVVLLNDVFEHLEDPRTVVLKLAAALRPGGALFLQTLNGQSLSLAVHPTRWAYFIHGHFVVPTLVSLSHYFRAAKLEVVRLDTHGYSSRSYSMGPRRGFLRSFCDKSIAAVCGRLDLGHRVKALVESRASLA